GINYKRETPLWRGSVLVVLREETEPGWLEYGYARDGHKQRIEGECLLKEKGRAFWKYNLEAELHSEQEQELMYEVTWGVGVRRSGQPLDEKLEGQAADFRDGEGAKEEDRRRNLGREEDGVCRASWWVPGRNE